PLSPTMLLSALPPGLELVRSKCLENNRELRYQHAAEIGAELQRLSLAADTKTRTRAWKVAAATAAAAVATVVATYSYWHPKPNLKDKDTIVLADFVNSTGDPVFDGALRHGLAVQLEQSPFLSLISEERIQQTLRFMRQSAEVRLTPALAREICE